MTQHPAPLQFVLDLLEAHAPMPGETDEARARYRYLDAGHIDSFGLIHFIMDIETEYGITLEPEDTQSDEFRTVGGLAGIIARKIGA